MLNKIICFSLAPRFMLNSTDKKFQMLIKTKILTNEEVSCLSLTDVVFIMLINVKMPAIVCIVTFMSWINLLLL